MIQNLRSGDSIKIKLFENEKDVLVISTGDNRFDQNGNLKEKGFLLNE